MKALLEPTLLQYRTSLSTQTMPEIAVMTSRFGYQLIGQTTVRAHLKPRAAAARPQSRHRHRRYVSFAKVLDDEIKRRMSIRPRLRVSAVGSHSPAVRDAEEQQRIEAYLFDEGYFDATVKIYPVPLGIQYADVRATITLHEKYAIGKVTIACPPGAERRKGRCYDTLTGAIDELPMSDSNLRGIFKTERCVIDALNFLCSGDDFSRARYQRTSRLSASACRRSAIRACAFRRAMQARRSITTQTVDPVISIDPRRRVEVRIHRHRSRRVQRNNVAQTAHVQCRR